MNQFCVSWRRKRSIGGVVTTRVIADASEIQNWLDTPSVTLIVVPAGEWRVKPLLIRRSNLTVRLAAGASLFAERRSLGPTENIIKLPRLADGRVANVTIEGDGTTSVIGFDADESYVGEHRHAIGVFNSDHVTIRRLRIQNTYGDGVTVGDDGETRLSLKRCRHVTLEDLEIDRASRCAVSWVSCEDFAARRIVATNIRPIATGVAPTGPWTGLAIEPDQSEQALSGVVEDFTVDGCDGSGINIELANAACDQDANIARVRISRPTVRNAGGAGIRLVNAFEHLRGSFTVEGATVEGTGRAGITVRDKAHSGPNVVFRDCTVAAANGGDSESVENQAPIVVYKQTANLTFQLWRVQDGAITLDATVTDNALPDLVWVAGRSDGFEIHNVTGKVIGSGAVHVEHANGIGIETG